MDRSVIAFVEGVVAFIVISATGMSAISLWLRSRAQARTQSDNAGIEVLRDENAELRTRLGELEERVDFVERRLVQEQQPARLQKQSDQTPV